MKRKTVGALSLELKEKIPDTRDPIELQREMLKSWNENIEEAISRGYKSFTGDFFIEVQTKKERLLDNVLRNFFMIKPMCPTPSWDQTVYHYHRNGDTLEFLWVVPSRDTCEIFMNHVLEIVPEEKELLSYVMDFEDGTLLQKAKKLNKEIE